MPAPLRRLIAKYDPVERDRRNRALGRAGEEFVVEIERRQLAGIGRQDFSRRVRWIADEDGLTYWRCVGLFAIWFAVRIRIKIAGPSQIQIAGDR